MAEDFITGLKQIIEHLKVEDIMSQDPQTLTPEKTLWHAKEIMRLRKISGVPIVDENGKLIGIVSIEDIIIALEGGYIRDPIKEHMTRNVVYLQPHDNVETAMEYFERYGFGRFPVLDREKKLVGVVTKEDILRGILKWFSTVYTHDERRNNVLESDYYYRSLITGEPLDKKGADFAFEIDYTDVNLAGVGAAKLKSFLTEKGLPSDTVRRISIATYEAETNVVIHSGSCGVIYCFLSDSSVKVRVEDYGKGIEDVELAMQEGYSTAPDHVRELGFGAGMGLANMKRFSDKMMIVSEVGKGVIVEMLFYFERSGDSGNPKGNQNP